MFEVRRYENRHYIQNNGKLQITYCFEGFDKKIKWVSFLGKLFGCNGSLRVMRLIRWNFANKFTFLKSN